MSDNWVFKILRGAHATPETAGRVAEVEFPPAEGSWDRMLAAAAQLGSTDHPGTRDDTPEDTLEMARMAVRDLVELDGIGEEEAWRLVREIRLHRPDVRGYYRAAKLKQRAEDGPLGARLPLALGAAPGLPFTPPRTPRSCRTRP